VARHLALHTVLVGGKVDGGLRSVEVGIAEPDSKRIVSEWHECAQLKPRVIDNSTRDSSLILVGGTIGRALGNV